MALSSFFFHLGDKLTLSRGHACSAGRPGVPSGRLAWGRSEGRDEAAEAAEAA